MQTKDQIIASKRMPSVKATHSAAINDSPFKKWQAINIERKEKCR